MAYLVISDNWQLAYHHASSSLQLLKASFDIEKRIVFLLNEKSRYTLMDIEYLQLGAEVDLSTEKLYQFIIPSVLTYQAMMEAIINHAITTNQLLEISSNKMKQLKKEYKKGEFYCQWVHTLQSLNKEVSSFEEYFSKIYKNLRVPLTHSTPSGSIKLDYSVSEILNGYSEGWEAYRLLSEGVGTPHDKGSWEILCNKYSLPISPTNGTDSDEGKR